MTDPIMMSVATALAGKAADAAADGVRTSWAALVRLVRARLAADHAASAALRSAESGAAGEAPIHELAAALDRTALADPEFGARLRELWGPASAELAASEGGVVNSSTGTVGGHLIQARDLNVQGGLHLGGVQGIPPP